MVVKISCINNEIKNEIKTLIKLRKIQKKFGDNNSLINTISKGNSETFNLDCSKINNLLELK